MGEVEEKNPNQIYIVFELVEDILLRLPLKSIFNLKTVSKQWKSTLESRTFAEKRTSFQKSRKTLSAIESEIEMVYLQCDSITRRSFTCDGLVCTPVQGSIEIHPSSPSTGPILRYFPIPYPYRVMGCGKDEVDGSYKIVMMLPIIPNHWQIASIGGGKWRSLSPVPYKIQPTSCKSVCVSGSIYWLSVCYGYNKILALDLHTEEFRHVSVPSPLISNIVRKCISQIFCLPLL